MQDDPDLQVHVLPQNLNPNHTQPKFWGVTFWNCTMVLKLFVYNMNTTFPNNHINDYFSKNDLHHLAVVNVKMLKTYQDNHSSNTHFCTQSCNQFQDHMDTGYSPRHNLTEQWTVNLGYNLKIDYEVGDLQKVVRQI